MPAGLGLGQGADMGRAAAFVFVVPLGPAAGRRRSGRPHLRRQRERLLVPANLGLGRVVRPFIQRQKIFHALDVWLLELRQAPHFFRHGFQS